MYTKIVKLYIITLLMICK